MSLEIQPVKVVVFELLTKTDCKRMYKDHIILEIMRYQNSTRERAEDFFKGMTRLGLGVCKKRGIDDIDSSTDTYSIPKFAYLRNFITKPQYAKLLGHRLIDT